MGRQGWSSDALHLQDDPNPRQCPFHCFRSCVCWHHQDWHEGSHHGPQLHPRTKGEPPIEVVIPEIPDILVDLIGAGTYQAQAKILLEDGSEMTCLYVRVEIA